MKTGFELLIATPTYTGLLSSLHEDVAERGERTEALAQKNTIVALK
jgi:hypothetical protein